MKKIGLFGGSFDPIHNGHCHLVKEAQKCLQLDKVIIFPAAVSPFKTKTPPRADGEMRLAMLRLAFEEEELVEISDVEIKRGGISYTIETVKFFKAKYPNDQLYLLLSYEALSNFSKWKSFAEIKKNVHLIFVGPLQATEEEVSIKIPWIEISSTQIRDALKKHKDCKKFISFKVLDYIRRNSLYS